MKILRKDRNYNAGYNTSLIETANGIYRKNQVSSDTENRRYVIKKVIQYIKEGKSKDEAISLVMQEKKVQEDFDYYRKNNIDLKMCIENWIKKPLNKIEQEDLEK